MSNSLLKCFMCNETVQVGIAIEMKESVYGMCKNCTSSFYREVSTMSEDWKFEPNTGGLQGHRNAKYTLTHVKKNDDNEMDDYEITDDPSTKKTQDMKDEYAEKNHKMWGSFKPFSTSMNSLGS